MTRPRERDISNGRHESGTAVVPDVVNGGIKVDDALFRHDAAINRRGSMKCSSPVSHSPIVGSDASWPPRAVTETGPVGCPGVPPNMSAMGDAEAGELRLGGFGGSYEQLSSSWSE
jgi:hypothetical protein